MCIRDSARASGQTDVVGYNGVLKPEGEKKKQTEQTVMQRRPRTLKPSAKLMRFLPNLLLWQRVMRRVLRLRHQPGVHLVVHPHSSYTCARVRCSQVCSDDWILSKKCAMHQIMRMSFGLFNRFHAPSCGHYTCMDAS